MSDEADDAADEEEPIAWNAMDSFRLDYGSEYHVKLGETRYLLRSLVTCYIIPGTASGVAHTRDEITWFGLQAKIITNYLLGLHPKTYKSLGIILTA
jgi:hypothetical protein